MKNGLGITLLEVLIVIAILGISATIAVPSFITFLQEHRLTLTSENLYYALRAARVEAIKRNTTVYVSFQTGDSWCYGVNTGSACNCATASSCNLGSTQAPQSQQLSLSTSGISGGNFTFEGTRGASNVSAGQVTLTVYGQTPSMTVKIGVLGNVQLCSSTVSGYQACS